MKALLHNQLVLEALKHLRQACVLLLPRQYLLRHLRYRCILAAHCIRKFDNLLFKYVFFSFVVLQLRLEVKLLILQLQHLLIDTVDLFFFLLLLDLDLTLQSGNGSVFFIDLLVKCNGDFFFVVFLVFDYAEFSIKIMKR